MRRLPKHVLQTLEKLGKSGITEGFYLAGGTALAIRYNHRVSVDLDFFTFPEKELNVERILNAVSHVELVVAQSDTLIFFSKPEGVKVSFFKYNAPLIEKAQLYKDNVFLASDIDIASMKAVAIAQRGSKKDFFDLWFLMRKHGWNLSNLEKALAIKYPSWNFGIFLRALTYFEDAEDESYEDIDCAWEEVKNYFRSIVSEAVKQEAVRNKTERKSSP